MKFYLPVFILILTLQFFSCDLSVDSAGGQDTSWIPQYADNVVVISSDISSGTV